MKDTEATPRRRGAEVFALHDGLARRGELLAAGLSAGQIRGAVRRGDWVVIRRELYGLASWAPSPKRSLLAACLATGGVASHSSAAWLWELLRAPPDRPVVTVAVSYHPTGRSHVATGRLSGVALEDTLKRVTVHYSTDLREESISQWRGIPTTNPLRTLVDLAGEVAVDEALDRALARGLVTVEALMAEVARLGRRGRRGPPQLHRVLVERGFVDGPPPSVLESKFQRLLAANGIEVVCTEVVTTDGRYRIDAELAGDVFVEVDGYAYHWSPEQKERDEERRNNLRLLGYNVLVYGWRAVTSEGRRVVREVRAAQSLAGV